MFKYQSESKDLTNVKIYFLPNRVHINLKEAIEILKKPFITESIQCTQSEPQPGKWYIYIEYDESNKITDGIEWEETGTTLLPNKKNPMVIAKYFSSKNMFKSVFKLIKNNKYDASLVNYTNELLPMNFQYNKIGKVKTHVSKKKSIKTIMKERIEKMKKKKFSTQNNDDS